jgi:bifunctional non-homologous end joining protein LigD
MNASSETWQLGDQAIQVSHLEKVYWPQTGFTKGDLLGYYRQIAPVALPYLKDRPVTLRVYPHGVEGASYYLRDCPEDAPDWRRRVDYQPKTVSHAVPLPLIDTVAGLLWFANQGAIEFHLWGSHLPDLTQPDLAIFDLDPGEAASFDAVREAGLRLHDALVQAGLRGYPKTSGGGGLHVFVPLASGHTFARVRVWAKAVGQQLESKYPCSWCDAPWRPRDGGLRAEQRRAQHGHSLYAARSPGPPDGFHAAHLGGTGCWHHSSGFSLAAGGA